MGFDGFSVIFAIFPILFICVFILIIATIVSQFMKSAKQNRVNNNSPILDVDATVVTKRTDVTVRKNGTAHHAHSTTRYYVTFQVVSGDRMELEVQDVEYGILVENDSGKLKFQGTRFLGFSRM